MIVIIYLGYYAKYKTAKMIGAKAKYNPAHIYAHWSKMDGVL